MTRITGYRFSISLDIAAGIVIVTVFHTNAGYPFYAWIIERTSPHRGSMHATELIIPA